MAENCIRIRNDNVLIARDPFILSHTLTHLDTRICMELMYDTFIHFTGIFIHENNFSYLLFNRFKCIYWWNHDDSSIFFHLFPLNINFVSKYHIIFSHHVLDFICFVGNSYNHTERMLIAFLAVLNRIIFVIFFLKSSEFFLPTYAWFPWSKMTSVCTI